MTQKYHLENPQTKNSCGGILFHTTFVLVLFAILVIIRLPILANADIYLTGDEGFISSDMASLFRGGDFYFYHDNVSYEGIVSSLFTLPFFMLFGINAVAFKLPAALFYSLYIWSMFILSRRIDNRMAWIVTGLLVLCPPSILELTTLVYSNVLIGFFANLAFIIFLNNRETQRPSNVFWIFLIMGFSLYANTFSVIYLAVLLILFLLNSELTFRNLKNIIKPSNPREVLARGIDFLLLLYISAITLTYIAGGLVLRADSFHILTLVMNWNQPYIGVLNLKTFYVLPFTEFFLIFILRIIIFRQDIKNGFEWVSKTPVIRLWAYGFTGFLVGLFPRWIGLADKQISGHAGFEVNIHPSGILHKTYDLLLVWIPKLFHLNFSDNWANSIFISALLIGSSIYLISSWAKRPRTDMPCPKEIFIILPVVLILTVFIYQKPHTIRHLLPLYVSMVFAVAFSLYKIREKTIIGFILLMGLWIGFYGYASYEHYRNKGIIKDFSIIKKEDPSKTLIEFLRKEKIPLAYTNYSAHTLNFLSGENPIFNEFYENALHGWVRKEKSKSINNFAVIFPDDKYRKHYEKYLEESSISCNRKYLNKFLVISQCQGEPDKIDRLRSLAKWTWQ